MDLHPLPPSFDKSNVEDGHKSLDMIPFRSPLLREYCSLRSSFFLFLWVLRCFTSPGALCRPMNLDDNILIDIKMGFPIRKSPDQRLLATFPRLIAGCYVLLRLLASRHPPSTLECYLTTKIVPSSFY